MGWSVETMGGQWSTKKGWQTWKLMLNGLEKAASLGGNSPLLIYPFPLVPAARQGVLWLLRISKREGTSPIERVSAKITELIKPIQTNRCWGEA